MPVVPPVVMRPEMFAPGLPTVTLIAADVVGVGSETDIYAARLDSNGNVIDTTPLIISQALYDQTLPRVAWNNSNWLVAWITKRPGNSFMSDIHAVRVAPDGTALDGAPIVVESSDLDPNFLHVVSDGTNWSLMWGTGTYSSSIYGARISPGGTLLDTTSGLLLADADTPHYAPAIAWDGAQYTVTYTDSRNRGLLPLGDVWATRVDVNGAVQTPGGFPVANSPLPEEQPTVVAMNGTSIFAYAAFRDRAPFASFRIALRKFPFDANYSINASPLARTIAPGGTTTYTVNVAPQNGFNGNVAFSVYGLPGGASAVFSPPSVTGTGSTTFTVATLDTTPEESYQLSIVGTNEAQQSIAQVTLVVSTNPPAVGYTITDTGTFGGTESVAYAINNNGQIVGYAKNTAAKRRPFLYNAGTLQDLGTFGGTEGEAYGINELGHVVGYAKNASNYSRAFLYSDGVKQDLGTLGGEISGANDINNSGQMVGYATILSGARRAFIYDGTAMRNLNDLIPPGSGWVLTEAFGINDSGQIVGQGTFNSQTRAFLLTLP